MWGVVCMGLVAASLMAGGAAAPAAEGQGYTVAGRVVDQVTGVPVARAQVLLEPVSDSGARSGGGSRPGRSVGQTHANTGGAGDRPAAVGTVTTGMDGSFQFTGVPEGQYRLAASRRGYLTASLDQEGEFFAAVITGSGHQETSAIQLRLAPEAEIRGRVQDSSGDPVEAASVTLFRRVFDGTGRVMAVRTTSLELGSSSYVFAGLQPDTYYVAASGRPWWAQAATATTGADNAETGAHSGLDVAYPVEFFDGARSAEQAEPIALGAGEIVDANLTLQAVPAVHIQIPVQPGRPFPQMEAPAFDGGVSALSSQTSHMRRNGDETTMEVSMAPGNYLVGGPGSATVSVANDMSLPIEAAPQPVSLSGQVGMADGSALPEGTQLLLIPENGTGFAGGFQFGGVIRSGFGPRPVTLAVRADGSVPASSVMPGSFTLTARRPGMENVVVMGIAAQGATVSGVKVTIAGEPVMLATTLAKADGTVTGKVVDERGAAAGGVMVLLVPEDAAQIHLDRQDESNLDGSFRFDTVAAGRYRVLAIADGWGMAWKDKAVLGKYMARGEWVQADGTGRVMVLQPVVVQAR